MRNNKFLLIPFFILLIVIVVELVIYSNYSSFTGKKKHITYITYGNSADAWSELKDGATSFLKKDAGDVTVFTSSVEEGASGQIALIENALSSSCDAIVIAPIYSSEMDEYLENLNAGKKVIVLSAGADSNQVYHLYPDDEAIALSIGQNVVSDGKKSVLILSYGDSDTIGKRVEVLEKLFDEQQVLYTYYCAENKNYDYELLKNNLAVQAFDGVVALDRLSLEAAVELSKESSITGDIYGISNTREAVYWLDTEFVKNLIYVDEFSLGYISAQMALEKKPNKSNLINSIRYYDVNKENMYEDDLSKVLFPFDN